MVSEPNENAQTQELIPTFASQARFGSMFDGSYDSAHNQPEHKNPTDTETVGAADRLATEPSPLPITSTLSLRPIASPQNRRLHPPPIGLSASSSSPAAYSSPPLPPILT
jgi:hypothetical protein